MERRIRRSCSKEKGTDKEWAREKVQMWRVRMKEGDKEESIRLGERRAGEEKKGGGDRELKWRRRGEGEDEYGKAEMDEEEWRGEKRGSKDKGEEGRVP